MVHSGPIHLRLRTNKYNPSTIATHTHDLYEILKEDDKPGCMIIADGGPDYSPKNFVNSLFYFRLFKALNLDMLSVFTYAARCSAYNPIEHLWSTLSNHLAGVVFSPKLDGDTKPPCDQSKLSAAQLKKNVLHSTKQ